LDGYEWSAYEQLFSGDEYPEPIFEPGFIPPRPKKVPVEEGLNTDLLFVGNITRIADSQRVTSQLLQTCFVGSWLQHFGRVRFLLWMNEVDKERMLPQAVQARARPSVIADTVADLTEIASSGTKRHGKGFSTNKLPATQGAVLTDAEIPTYLKRKILKPTVERLGAKVKKELDRRAEWLERIAAGGRYTKRLRSRAPKVEQALRKPLHEFLAHIDKIVYIPDSHDPYSKIPIENLIARYDTAMLNAQKSTEEKREEAAREQGITFTQEEKDSFAEFEEEYLLATTGDRQRSNSVYDESYARSVNPPLLQAWERRNNDPVIADPAITMFPSRPLTLIDFAPKLMHKWFRHEDTDEAYKRYSTYDRLVRAIFSLRAQTIKAALKTLAPGAEDVLQMIPDGKELGKKRVRCASIEELVKIAQAWQMWPFKPEEDDHLIGYNREQAWQDGNRIKMK
jgi:hypothetical protein